MGDEQRSEAPYVEHTCVLASDVRIEGAACEACARATAVEAKRDTLSATNARVYLLEQAIVVLVERVRLLEDAARTGQIALEALAVHVGDRLPTLTDVIRGSKIGGGT